MQNNTNDRRISVYELLKYKTNLKQLASFSENVARCNFKTKVGWGLGIGQGKTYVSEHGLDEYKPEILRGITVLDLYYLKLTDYVVLTDEQYNDYITIIGPDY